MAVSSPKDKYGRVWLIFFMLGLGTLLPWNFFMTATVYFTGRLKDSSLDVSSANQTEAAGEQRSVLEAKFNNVMTLCAMLPLLLCTCLNSFLHSLIPQRLRVMGSLLVIMFVFAITAVLVKVPLEPLPFFSITMVKIVIINSFGAVLQGSLFGMAGLLPASYTTPIMSGQGLAGTFAAFAMICAIASGSVMQEAAFGYFITACAVIFLSVLSYILLPRLEFFQFYQERNQKQTTSDEEQNSVSLMNRENKDEAADQKIQDVSMMNIFKKIWILALSVCFTFTVTIGTFPAITADTQSTLADGGSWDLYFIPVSCFLLFNLSDWGGRSLTAICMWGTRQEQRDHTGTPGAGQRLSFRPSIGAQSSREDSRLARLPACSSTASRGMRRDQQGDEDDRGSTGELQRSGPQSDFTSRPTSMDRMPSGFPLIQGDCQEKPNHTDWQQHTK